MAARLVLSPVRRSASRMRSSSISTLVRILMLLCIDDANHTHRGRRNAMQADAVRDDRGAAMHTIHGSWNDSPDAVTLIDAHHHLWNLAQRKHPNLIGAPRHDFFMGDDSAIRRDYLAEDYRRDAAGHNVLTSVHCEAEWDRADQIGETRWITG